MYIWFYWEISSHHQSMAKRKRQQDKAANEKKTADEVGDDERSFEELGLEARLVRALSKKSIEKPTPIQRLVIPPIMVCIFRSSSKFAITSFLA